MSDLVFVVYDKHSVYQRRFVPAESSVDLLPFGIPAAEFTLDDDDPALAPLTAKGARCAFRFRGVEWFRGMVKATPGEGPLGRTTVRVQGDMRKLWEWQGRPVPAAALTAQTVERARYGGPTETAVKAALAANFTRLGVPWTTATNHARGKTASVELRFHPLADKVVPFLDRDDLIPTLAYTPAGGVIFDVREADIVHGELSELTGAVEGWEWTRDAPSVTRVIGMGRGEGVAREFAEVRALDREADWGDIIESAVDLRNTDVGTDLTIEARETLAEGAATVGVSLTVQESKHFQLGVHYLPGDRVRVRVGPVDVLERISSVRIVDDPDEGVVVTPHIGAPEDSPDAELGAQVARLARGQRDTGRL